MTNDDQKLHVVLIADRFSLRGSSAYTLRLLRDLPRAGIQATVVCANASLLVKEQCAEQGLRVYPLLQSPLWGRVALRNVLHDLRHLDIDLIHAQSKFANRAAVFLARHLRRPYLTTIHDYLAPRESLDFDRAWCRGIIAVSESVRDDLISRQRIESEWTTVVTPGVDLPDEPVAEVLPKGRVPVIGTAGPLETSKGFPFFLGAAARILESGRDVEFVLAGAGPQEHNLRRIATELGILERLTLVPNLSDLSAAMEAMDIFCLPSLQQGLGTMLLEAMALSRPVIATRVGGVHRVIDEGVTGFLVPPSDSVHLAQRMSELLDDPERARRMGQAGYEKVVSQFSAVRMIEQTEAIYRAAVAESDSAIDNRKLAATEGAAGNSSVDLRPS